MRFRGSAFVLGALFATAAACGGSHSHGSHDDDGVDHGGNGGGHDNQGGATAGSSGHPDGHDGAGAGMPSGTVDMAPSPVDVPKGPPTVEVKGDRWSDPATWGGKVPGEGAKVEIPAGRTILVDVDPAKLGGLTIKGTLVFADRDVALTSAYVYVAPGGRFQLGEPERPFTKKAVITLTGRTTADIPEVSGGFGAKVFASLDGIVDIHGAPVGKSWTKLAAEAAAGATKLELLEAPGWKVGDRLVIAPSSIDQSQYDDVEVAAIEGKTVTLKAALKHAHYGQVRKVGETDIDVRAEVGSLTRNILIQGDADSEMLKIGAHMMFMATKTSTVRLSNIEVTKMGQLNQLRRYPIHFHVMMTKCEGCFVKDVAVHDTVQRGIVIHDTAKVLVMGNVVFNTVGHNIIVETQTTAGSTFHRNLAMVNRMPMPAITTPGLKEQSDDIPSGFWIRNSANVFTENAVGGSQGMGMWFDDVRGGPLVFQRNTVHAAMTMGADRDFNMQSGVLLDCDSGFEQPATAKVTDLLVYQNGFMGAKSPAGFWPEHCTTFRKGFTPFEISRIYAIDNAGTNIELRHQPDVYTMSDVIVTGSLLGGADKGAGVFAQYGGTVTLVRPTFGFYKRAVLASNDILGPWIARFRVQEAKFVSADKATVANANSLTEALDDSYLPKGAYLVADGDKPTLKVGECATMPGDDYGIYRCPKLFEMGFLVVRQGDKADGEGEQMQGGAPLHTVMPIARADGAKFMPTNYGFGGYELVWNTPLEYKLDRQPQGTITGVLYPMGNVSTGFDEGAGLTLAIPLAAAPKGVYRTNSPDDVFSNPRVPKAADKLTAVGSAAELATKGDAGYHYDAAAKVIRLRASTRWFIVEP